MSILSRIRQKLRRPLRTLSSQQAYAQWAATYPAHAHNRLMAVEQEAMLAVMPPLKGRAVLDLACGTGRYAQIARQQGAALVVGVDDHLTMLRGATVPDLAQGTMEAIPLPTNSMNVVICGLALGHLPRVGPAMREISRVLRGGGICVLSDFHPFQYLRGAQRTFIAADGRTYAVEHYAHLYADYAEATRSAGLSIQLVREPILPEGDGTPVVLVLRLEKRT